MPGKVKTRLQPELSSEQAARVAEILIQQTVQKAKHWPGPVTLSAWPHVDHDFIQRLARDHGLHTERQCAGDLGRKMDAALTARIQLGRPAAVMGCDVPHCPLEVLHTAAAELARGRPVLGPSSDGGYYLIGLTIPGPALFQDIDWGTDTVLEQTLQRAKTAGIEFILLPELADLDTWTDLISLKDSIPELAAFLNEN